MVGGSGASRAGCFSADARLACPPLFDDGASFNFGFFGISEEGMPISSAACCISSRVGGARVGHLTCDEAFGELDVGGSAKEESLSLALGGGTVKLSGWLAFGWLALGGFAPGRLTSGGLTLVGLTSGGLTSGGLTCVGLTSGGLMSGGLTSGGLTCGGLGYGEAGQGMPGNFPPLRYRHLGPLGGSGLVTCSCSCTVAFSAGTLNVFG